MKTRNVWKIWTIALLGALSVGVTAWGQSDFVVNANGTLTGYKGKGGDVTIPETVNDVRITSIGSRVFRNNSDLTSVSLPSGVTSIGSEVFYSCSNLTTVTLNEGLLSIGGGAFENCFALTDIRLPQSLLSIDGSAFLECSALQSIVIPDNVTTIGWDAFAYCYGLTTVSIGSSVTDIGGNTFLECSALENIYCRLFTPPATESNVFGYTEAFSNCNLHVPDTAISEDAYRNADTWKDFANILADIPVGYILTGATIDTFPPRVDTTVIVEVIDTIDTCHYDTNYVDTTIYDNITYVTDTNHIDTLIKDTLELTYILYTDTVERDTIIYNYTDTNILTLTDSVERDTILYHVDHRIDTIIYDTIPVRSDTLIYDTLWHHDTLDAGDTLLVIIYDTLSHTTLDVVDTIRTIVHIIDSTLPPDTLIVRDTIVKDREVETPTYVIINSTTSDPGTSTPIVVRDNARAITLSNGNVLLEGLTPHQVFAIYSASGALIFRANALGDGTYLLPALPKGTYILWHGGKWGKIGH